MKDILKQLFGEAVTEDALKQFNAELGKKFVAKSDYNTKLEVIKNLESEKGELEGKISTLTDEAKSAEDVRKELEDLKADIKEKEEKERLEAEDRELTTAIMEAIGNKEFSSDYAKEGVIRDMKSLIAQKENKGKSYAELFDGLIKDREGILANPNPPAPMPGMGRVDTGDGEKPIIPKIF